MSHSMDKRFDAQAEYLQYKPTRSALDTSGGIRGASSGMGLHSNPISGKFTEKEAMRGLNERLAGFIEKVHHLEYQNSVLEKEIKEIRGKAKPSSSCLEEKYGPELRKLRQLIQDITHQKIQIEIEHDTIEDELVELRRKHEQEARGRSDAEKHIVVLKKDVNAAYQAKLQLDKKAQALVDEISFLKRTHEAEMSEMFDQIQKAQVVTLKAHEFGNADVTAALRDIRTQLEGHTVSDLQQVEGTFRSQFAKLTEAAETKREALRAAQQEIQEFRRRLQATNTELDCAQGTREALERQLHDVEDRHKEEMIHYQNTIRELENELMNSKFDMSGYMREYHDLLNVKIALDVEILSYRKLLCAEESRLTVMSDSHVSLPYIYHQSPVYTLPRLNRPGAPHRRAEPQYKFVEEIITETTREIEMSEFEESGSDETETGKYQWASTRRHQWGSEDENYNKDSGESEGEQMYGRQQNQVGHSVDGWDDKSPVEVKGLLRESPAQEESKQHEKIAENLKDEKEAEIQGLSRAVQVQDDKLYTLAPEAAENPTYFTAGTKRSNLSVETEECSEENVSMSEGKELKSNTEKREIGEFDAPTGEEKVAESIGDSSHERYKGQDEEVSPESDPKSDAKGLPGVEGQRDETQTVLPKEKANVSAEIKELHQGAAASSQVQTSKPSEVSEKMSDPQKTKMDSGKTEK